MIRSWASGRVLGVGAAFAAAIGVGFLLPQTASAATTCTAPPGAPAEVVQIDGDEACGASTDGTAEAWSYGERGVGFADARSAAQVVAAGFDGGVGAGESTSGRLFAIGVGAQALALGVLESPGTAVVAAGPQSQAYVATPTIRCCARAPRRPRSNSRPDAGASCWATSGTSLLARRRRRCPCRRFGASRRGASTNRLYVNPSFTFRVVVACRT